MRGIAFAVAISGIGFLVVSLIFPPVDFENFDNIELNDKVILKGVVSGEKNYGDFRILKVDGIDVLCNCEKSFLGEEVEIIGLVDEFNEKIQIRVLKFHN